MLDCPVASRRNIVRDSMLRIIVTKTEKKTWFAYGWQIVKGRAFEAGDYFPGHYSREKVFEICESNFRDAMVSAEKRTRKKRVR